MATFHEENKFFLRIDNDFYPLASLQFRDNGPDGLLVFTAPDMEPIARYHGKQAATILAWLHTVSFEIDLPPEEEQR